MKEVPINQLYISPLCVRLDKDPSSLAKSISSMGLLHPPIVRETGHGYEVLVGARRVEAAKTAGLQSLLVRVVDVDSDVEILKMVLAENLEREDLKPGELIKAVKALYERLGSSRKVAAALNHKLDDSYIRKLLKLSNLDEQTVDDLPLHMSIEFADVFANVRLPDPKKTEKERMLREKIKDLSVEEAKIVLQAFRRNPEEDVDKLVADALAKQKVVVYLPLKYMVGLKRLAEQMSVGGKKIDYRQLAASIIMEYLDKQLASSGDLLVNTSNR